MRLTILMPFIGAFLLFNATTAKWLALPEQIARDFGMPLENDWSYNLNSLYYTYFGLVLLGIGSIIFAIFCPREIQTEPDITRFVANRIDIQTPSLTKRRLRELRTEFIENTTDGDKFRENSITVTANVAGAVHDLFNEILLKTKIYHKYLLDKQKEDEDEYRLRYVVNWRMDISIDRYIEDTFDVPLAHSAFLDELHKIIKNMTREVLYTWYIVKDMAQYKTRLIVFMNFMLGFIFLVIPSAITFFKVFILLVSKIL
jgi:hypothetical protein